MAGRNRLVRDNSRVSGTMQSGISKKQIDPGILLDMKNEIEEKKSQVASLEGSKKTLISQLVDYECKTLDDANKLIGKKRTALEKKKIQFEEGTEKLLNDYDWDFRQ